MEILFKQFLNALKSEVVIVLIMNFLSCEKKKKLPLLPYDSPALNTISLFFSALKLSLITSKLIPSNILKYANTSGAYSVTNISSFIVNLSSSNDSSNSSILMNLQLIHLTSLLSFFVEYHNLIK